MKIRFFYSLSACLLFLLQTVSADPGEVTANQYPSDKPEVIRQAGEKRTLNIGGIDYTFCWCPPGTFLMGSPENEAGRNSNEKQHEVTLTHGFWLLETEVTQTMWANVMGNNPSYFKGDRLPVEQVNWDECREFCRELSRLSVNRKFRLPYEAEWEYACRAGTKTPFHFGGMLNGDQANCNGEHPYGTENKGRNMEQTCTVKSYEPNAWGLYDMHGNVWEWCDDLFEEYPETSVTNPIGSATGSYRVIRGGSWNRGARGCRSAYRGGPSYPRSNLGFRIILIDGE